VVLANGEILTNMNETLKNNTGYDLKQLFIGSEGTLGIITRAVLRLRPAAPARQTALVACQTFDDTLKLLNVLTQKLEGKLSAFEAMWSNFYRMLVVKQQKHPAYLAPNYPFYVLVQSECVDADRGREQFLEILENTMEAGVIVDAIIAESHQQTEQLWALRDDIDTLARSMHPVIPYDISLPLRHMEEFTSKVEQTLTEVLPEADCVTFGHLGDGNIHFCVGPAADKSIVNNVVYGELGRLGGAVSAEHGVGYDKKSYLKYSRSEAEINLMRTIKKALDPNNILNPGKIFDL
jgi:FAD/FMN-containing dehydrogenase